VEERGLQFRAAQDRLIARLSEAAGDIDAVRDALEPVKTATDTPDMSRIVARVDDLRGRLDGIERPLRESPELDALAAECVDRIRRAINGAHRLRDDLANPGLVTVKATTVSILTHLDSAYDAILSLLVPYHLGVALHRQRVGRAVLLEHVLEDQKLRMPSPEKRLALLKRLERDGWFKGEGVIEPDQGRIWRRSSNGFYYAATLVSPLVFAALAALALVLAVELGFDELGSTQDVLTAYGLVLAGVVTSLAVENVKQFQGNSVSIVAIGNFTDWLHLRWVGIAASFVPLLATVIGIQVTLDTVDEALYFFAGWSVDSLSGVFLTRFGTAAASGVSRLNALIGAPAPSP
jgi:DNA-binding FrmR family transcriptional regulator